MNLNAVVLKERGESELQKSLDILPSNSHQIFEDVVAKVPDFMIEKLAVSEQLPFLLNLAENVAVNIVMGMDVNTSDTQSFSYQGNLQSLVEIQSRIGKLIGVNIPEVYDLSGKVITEDKGTKSIGINTDQTMIMEKGILCRLLEDPQFTRSGRHIKKKQSQLYLYDKHSKAASLNFENNQQEEEDNDDDDDDTVLVSIKTARKRKVNANSDSIREKMKKVEDDDNNLIGERGNTAANDEKQTKRVNSPVQAVLHVPKLLGNYISHSGIIAHSGNQNIVVKESEDLTKACYTRASSVNSDSTLIHVNSPCIKKNEDVINKIQPKILEMGSDSVGADSELHHSQLLEKDSLINIPIHTESTDDINDLDSFPLTNDRLLINDDDESIKEEKVTEVLIIQPGEDATNIESIMEGELLFHLEENGSHVLKFSRRASKDLSCNSQEAVKIEDILKLLKSEKDPIERLRLQKLVYETKAPFRFCCTLCSFRSQRQSHLDKHLILHKKNPTIHYCKTCDFTTIRRATLTKHLEECCGSRKPRKERKKREIKEYRCDKCEWKGVYKANLARHVAEEHQINENRLLHCHYCPYFTDKKLRFDRHVLTHESLEQPDEHSRVFRCSYGQCSYTSGKRYLLKAHVRDRHTVVQKVLCDLCGASFKRKHGLVMHRKFIHADTKPLNFTCTVCGKKFRSKAHLKEHEVTHTNKRAFLCETCGTAFKTRSAVRRHNNTVHNDSRNLACKSCQKKFFTKEALEKHTASGNGKCGGVFISGIGADNNTLAAKLRRGRKYGNSTLNKTGIRADATTLQVENNHHTSAPPQQQQQQIILQSGLQYAIVPALSSMVGENAAATASLADRAINLQSIVPMSSVIQVSQAQQENSRITITGQQQQQLPPQIQHQQLVVLDSDSVILESSVTTDSNTQVVGNNPNTSVATSFQTRGAVTSTGQLINTEILQSFIDGGNIGDCVAFVL